MNGQMMIAGGISFYLAVQYNSVNLYYGLTGAKDKMYALLCMLPVFQLFAAIYLASAYSQFWKEYCTIFMYAFGNSLTHVTGYFNLMSSSKTKFNPVFADFWIFLAILYVDHNRLAPREQIVMAYIAMIIVRTILYILFLRSMIQ
jgi:hypothetical protein